MLAEEAGAAGLGAGACIGEGRGVVVLDWGDGSYSQSRPAFSQLLQCGRRSSHLICMFRTMTYKTNKLRTLTCRFLHVRHPVWECFVLFQVRYFVQKCF